MDSASKKAHKIVTIPNVLSLFRLLLIPVMLELYLKFHEPIWTIVVLGISGLTDVADGRIARKYNMISDLGKVLDPLADKLTQLALLGCLFVQHYQLMYVFAVQVVKEIAMAVVGLVVIKKTRQVNSAVWHGKVCTVILYMSLLLLFLLPQMPEWVVWGLSIACMLAIVVSFYLYMDRYRYLLQQQKKQNASLETKHTK